MTTHKKSTILNWVLRILFAIILLLSACMLMLNLVTGTGEPQRQGLETAFSNALRMPVKIGQLNQFNAFPQFIIDASNLESTKGDDGRFFKADQVSVAAASFDLMQQKQTLQKFDVVNAEITAPKFSAKTFTNVNARIVPPTIQNNASKFEITADVNGKHITATVPMTHKKLGVHFNYSVQRPAKINIHYGACEMTGSINNSFQFNWDLPQAPHKDCKDFIALFKKP